MLVYQRVFPIFSVCIHWISFFREIGRRRRFSSPNLKISPAIWWTYPRSLYVQKICPKILLVFIPNIMNEYLCWRIKSSGRDTNIPVEDPSLAFILMQVCCHPNCCWSTAINPIPCLLRKAAFKILLLSPLKKSWNIIKYGDVSKPILLYLGGWTSIYQLFGVH